MVRLLRQCATLVALTGEAWALNDVFRRLFHISSHPTAHTGVLGGFLVARGNGRGTGRSGHWAVGGIGACSRLKVGCAIVTGQGGGLGGHGRREAWQRGRTRRRKGCTWTVEGPRRTGKSGSERKGLDRGEEEHGTDGSRHGDEAKTGGGEGRLPTWWVLKCNTWSSKGMEPGLVVPLS